MSETKIALVVGAGAFGTSIAKIVSHNFDKVIIKVRSEDVYNAIKNGENTVYLPGHSLPDNLYPALTWEEVDKINRDDIKLLISGLPTKAIASYFTAEKVRYTDYFERNIPIVSLSKGIDSETLELPDDLFFDLFPKHRDLFTFLSGPSFAKEIMEEQITLVTLAGKSKETITNVMDMIETPYFRCMGSYDIKGVLLGGALKNVIAIAGGIIEGLGYNHNTRAALITWAIAEMLRFGHVINARPETFYGFSGMGDLILTTTGGLSRNKQFGIEIAKGRKPQEIIDSQRTVVEGYKTAKAAYHLAEKFGVRAKIFEGVYKILYEDTSPEVIMKNILQFTSRFEIET